MNIYCIRWYLNTKKKAIQFQHGLIWRNKWPRHQENKNRNKIKNVFSWSCNFLINARQGAAERCWDGQSKCISVLEKPQNYTLSRYISRLLMGLVMLLTLVEYTADNWYIYYWWMLRQVVIMLVIMDHRTWLLYMASLKLIKKLKYSIRCRVNEYKT